MINSVKHNSLVYWNRVFVDMVGSWVKKEHPHFYKEWSVLIEKDITRKPSPAILHEGRNQPASALGGKDRALFKHPSNKSYLAVDRAGEHETAFHTHSLVPWIPFVEYPRKSFSDCMFESVKLLADRGKTIDFFWSGGLDSNACLLAFNELGLHKQLHVIMGGVPESPELFEKVVKGRMDYSWDETSTARVVFGLAKPDEHVLSSCAEFDSLFGHNYGFDADETTAAAEQAWNIKRRYYNGKNSWRNIDNFSGDWVNIDNYMPISMQEPLEKWLCNHVIDENIIYWDITSADWDDEDWWKKGIAPNAPGQEHYRKCKMPLRDFLYMLTKDEYISYRQPKQASMLKLDLSESRRIIAITNDGDCVTIDNFHNFDWTKYIVNMSDAIALQPRLVQQPKLYQKGITSVTNDS